MKKLKLSVMLAASMLLSVFNPVAVFAESTDEPEVPADVELTEEETPVETEGEDLLEETPAEEDGEVLPVEDDAAITDSEPETVNPGVNLMSLSDDDYDDEIEAFADVDYTGIVTETELYSYYKSTGLTPENGKYVIYNQGNHKVLSNSGNGLTSKTVNFDVLPNFFYWDAEERDPNTIFEISGKNIKANNGKYVQITSQWILFVLTHGADANKNTGYDFVYHSSITSSDAIEFCNNNQNVGRVRIYMDDDGSVNASSAASDSHAAFILYKEESLGTMYKVESAPIVNAISGVGEQKLYTVESWTAFKEAENAAEHYYYATPEEAYQAYQELVTAVDNLEKKPVMEAITPEISWVRTNEPKGTDSNSYGKLVVGVPYIPNSDANYSILTWGGMENQILGLTTDPSMTVWDYNTSKQYSNADKVNNIKAATWNEHERNNTGVLGWQNGSVRKFDGTFVWPEGYTLDDSASLVSVNDANYADIYAAVEADSALAARFSNSKVIAVNDDMFVFIYKDGETLTTDNYLDHLVFFSGASGKGRWSSTSTNADWGRTIPATFHDISATPAYYRILPNNADIDSSITTRTNRNWDDMKFSDGWYTLSNTSTISTTLKNLYGDEDLSNQKMHIAIYAFDNSGNGGMDELKIQMVKKLETSTSVEVRYWVGSTGTVGDENYLGTSYMTDVEYGTKITLGEGTNVNELNYRRAMAITKDGRDMGDGVQMAPVPMTVSRDGDNVINVVYVPKGNKTVVLTSETKTVEWTGEPVTANVVTVNESGYDSFTSTNAKEPLPGGNYIQNIAAAQTQTLPGIYPVTFTAVPFVSESANGEATSALQNYSVIRRVGQLTITYAPEPAAVTYDFAETNEYDILNDVEKAATSYTYNDAANIEVVDGKVQYTPASVNTGETLTLTLVYAGGYTCDKEITFYPATNVLYEESFFELEEGAGFDVYVDGNESGVDVINDNEDSVYGYTDAYIVDNGTYSAGSALYANLSSSASFAQTGKASFTFTGTGFDLISECSDNTGIVAATVKGNGITKSYIVDTYYSKGDAYQVPVIRNLSLPYGEYTVETYGVVYQSAGAVSSTKSRAATYALVEDTPDQTAVAAIMNKLGLYGDVEVAFMDEDSVLNGGTGNMTAPVAQQKSSTSLFDRLRGLFGGSTFGVSTMSLEPESGDTDIAIFLDGFRVYQPLKNNPEVYLDDEKDTKYASVYDFIAVTDEVGWIENAALFVEYDEEVGMDRITEYKNQGPQNEVYLNSDAKIYFSLKGYNEGDVVQIGAKSVRGDGSLPEIGALNPTEMYYDITDRISYDDDLGYYVEIMNDGEDGMLALSGLKISSHITPAASLELAEVVMNKEVPATFVPEVFTVTNPASVARGKSASLTIKTSVKDVTKIEIKRPDGSIATLTTENATNKAAVTAGKSTTYSFTYKLGSIAEAVSYELVAYNAEGKASAPITASIAIK